MLAFYSICVPSASAVVAVADSSPSCRRLIRRRGSLSTRRLSTHTSPHTYVPSCIIPLLQSRVSPCRPSCFCVPGFACGILSIFLTRSLRLVLHDPPPSRSKRGRISNLWTPGTHRVRSTTPRTNPLCPRSTRSTSSSTVSPTLPPHLRQSSHDSGAPCAY